MFILTCNSLLRSAVLILLYLISSQLRAQSTVSSTGLVPPKFSFEQIQAIRSPELGQLVFDTSFKCLRMYNGKNWVSLVQNNSLETIGYTFSASGVERGYAIAIDNNKNIYITGSFAGIITFNGAYHQSLGEDDVFTAKFNNTGTLQWIKFGKGRGYDTGRAIAVDTNGNVFVTGDFYEKINFDDKNLVAARTEDIFIVKYDTNGNLMWAEAEGGERTDQGTGIAVDASGNVFLTGFFTSTSTFGNQTLTAMGGSIDFFIAKYDPNGNLLWIEQEGGSGNDISSSISLDYTGNIYIAGRFDGQCTFGSNTVLSSVDNSLDIFVARYNPSGQLVWVEQEGGATNDFALGISVDVYFNVYVTGCFSGTATFGTNTKLTSRGGLDIFIARYNNGFSAVRQIGGASNEYPRAISANIHFGGVTITGNFQNSCTVDNLITLQSAGQEDIFVLKYSSNLDKIEWAERFGELYNDYGQSIVTDTSGNTYVTGYYSGQVLFGNLTLPAASNQDISMFFLRIRK